MKIKDISINVKLFGVILAELIISTFLVSTYAVHTIQEMTNESIERYGEQVIEAKKLSLKEKVDMAKNILQTYRDKVTPNTTDKVLEKIKSDAIKALDSMTYGDDNGYVFVWTYDGVPLAFNPRPDLIGKNLLHLKGGDGKWVIKDHIANAKKGGGHFYTYKWKTTKNSPYQTKLSYSFGVQDWRWFVGTGEYLAKEEKEIAYKKQKLQENTNELIKTIIVSASTLVFITSTILFYLIRGIIFTPLAKLKDGLESFFLFFQGKKNNIKEIDVKTSDEIGSMSKEINKNIKTIIELHSKLEQSHQYIRSILDSQNNFTIITDGEHLIDINKFTLDFFGCNDIEELKKLTNGCICNTFLNEAGYLQKEMDGKSWIDFIYNSYNDCKAIILNNYGERNIFIVNVNKLELSNENLYVVTFQDITELENANEKLQKSMIEVSNESAKVHHLNITLEQRVKEEVEKNRKKDIQIFEQAKFVSMGEMIGNIAHQWRQPLAGISSILVNIDMKKMSLNRENEEQVSEFLEFLNSKNERISNYVNFLSETIDTFRDFSQNGKNNSVTKEIILQDKIGSTIAFLNPMLVNNHIKIKTHFSTIEPIELILPNGQLDQVIINIINNAIDVLKERNIKIPCIEVRLIKEADSIIITIEDNAGGIPDDVMPKIFDPYFTTKHQSQGTGLGLHMSQKIVTESLNGKIYVENTKNGAKFFVELPL